jgi:hypothetical protein
MKNQHIRATVCFGLASAGSTPVAAEKPKAVIVKLPQDIEFKGPLAAAPQTIVLYYCSKGLGHG